MCQHIIRHIFNTAVKEQNVSCSELGGSTINSRLAVLELEVDCLKAKSVKSEEETTMIKKKPRLGKNKKAFSGGDIVSMHVYIQ